jgi:hypothetical protein
MAPAPTWSYSGANVTLGRQEDDGEEPCQEIQVAKRLGALLRVLQGWADCHP